MIYLSIWWLIHRHMCCRQTSPFLSLTFPHSLLFSSPSCSLCFFFTLPERRPDESVPKNAELRALLFQSSSPTCRLSLSHSPGCLPGPPRLTLSLSLYLTRKHTHIRTHTHTHTHTHSLCHLFMEKILDILAPAWMFTSRHVLFPCPYTHI